MSIKKENIINNIKTAGIVAGLSLTLNACHEKALTQQQMDVVTQKTDSAVNKHHEYRFVKMGAEFSGVKANKFHEKNRALVKDYSKSYIKNNITKSDLRKMMLKSLYGEEFVSDENEFIEFYADSVSDTKHINAHYIRRNERWFYDLIMYLNNNYSDRQLLNSEFFKIVKNKKLKCEFEFNTNEIEKMHRYSENMSKRGDVIYNQIRDKYVNEVKKSKQR